MSFSPYLALLDQKKQLLFTAYQLVVIDFDCTITNVSISEQTAGLPLEQKIEIRPFFNFVNYLRSIGVSVAIATYGKKTYVLEMTKGIFGLENPFNDSNIVTPATISAIYGIKWREGYHPPPGYSKNNMLQVLQGIIPNNEVLLLDDNSDNVLGAKTSGYQAIQTPQCQGFTSVLRTTLNYLLMIQPETYSANREFELEYMLKRFVDHH